MAAQNLVNIADQIKALIRSLYLMDVPSASTESAYANIEAVSQEASRITSLCNSQKQNLLAVYMEQQNNEALRLATSANEKATEALRLATSADEKATAADEKATDALAIATAVKVKVDAITGFLKKEAISKPSISNQKCPLDG